MSEPPKGTCSQADLTVHLRRLGLDTSGEISLLPSNLSQASSVDDLQYSQWYPDLKRALASECPSFGALREPADPTYDEVRGALFELPAVLLGYTFWADPASVQVVLNVVSSFIYDKMKRLGWNKATVRMSMIRRRGESDYLELRYEGPPESFKDLSSWESVTGDGGNTGPQEDR